MGNVGQRQEWVAAFQSLCSFPRHRCPPSSLCSTQCTVPVLINPLCTALRLPSPSLNPWRRFSWISGDLTVSFNKQLKQTARANHSCSLSLAQTVGRFEYWAMDLREAFVLMYQAGGTARLEQCGGGIRGLLQPWLVLSDAFPFPQIQWLSG